MNSRQNDPKPRPRQTRGEEIFNSVSHIVGGAFGVATLVLGVILAAVYNDAWCVVAMAIYGACIILAYTASSIYHALRVGGGKRIFRIFDHCSIFLLIVGTYTPFCFVTLRGAWGWSIIGALWGLAVIGIFMKAFFIDKKIVRVLSMVIFIGMGWCAVVAIVPILRVIHPVGLALTVAGGVIYTIGAVFYAYGHRAKFIHGVWHLFVLAGTLLHIFAVIFYVVLI